MQNLQERIERCISITESVMKVNPEISMMEYSIKELDVADIKKYDPKPNELADGMRMGIVPHKITNGICRIFLYSPATKDFLGKPLK